MAEQIISPGVFQTENDNSQYSQGIAQLGAVIVGPTQMGPAFIPTVISKGYNEFITKFGDGTSDTYVPHTVREYLNNASSITVLRVLGNGGWAFTPTRGLSALVATGSNTILTVFHPSKNSSPNSIGLEKSTISAVTSISGSFLLTLSGSGFSSGQAISASLVKTSPNFITKTVGKNEFNSLTGSVYRAYGYPYILFRDTANSSAYSASRVDIISSSADIAFTASIDGTSYSEGYTSAMTPFIIDGSNNRLFRFATLSHGFSTNTDVYVSIGGLIEPADINNVEQYSTFNLFIRKVGDSDKQPQILESYINVNLDPNSPNFIARVIGDRYYEYNSTLAKVVTKGNYANSSQYLRIVMSENFNNGLNISSLSIKASPRGFERFYQTIIGFTGYNLPPVSYTTAQAIDSVYNSAAFLGFDWTSQDNYNYLKPVPTSASIATLASQSNFTVNTLNGHPSASWVGSLSASVDLTGTAGPKSDQVQFSVALQGGSDGVNPATIRNVGSDISAANVFGYDLSSVSAAGARGFNKAINILSNRDEYDYNILAIPGVLNSLHSAVTATAINMVETRGDAFYIMDLIDADASVGSAANATTGLNSSYAGVYYPWVKILDPLVNRPIFVPPSVVIPGVFANNDKTAAPWFAPAGLNRGGLPTVIETKNKLSQSERDILYTARVNPIALFPGQGNSVWGQKTLQLKATALDRINVRRLLIELKKYIGSNSKYLVFDQNTITTRNRFLNIVNPYLETIQQRQGLYAYKVTCDESNNTSDVIDRNQLKGTITIQPTKTSEFIILDFNIQPTGVTLS